MQLAEESAHVTDSGERITGRREALHMTIEQLAAEAGVNADTLSDWERGRRKPRGSTVEAVHRALDRLEHEIGATAPARQEPRAGEPHIITIKGSRGGDIDVAVSGPIEDIEALTATVERLLYGPEGNRGDQGQPEE